MTEETISVIITILNGAKWIDKCFQSIAMQTAVQQERQAQNPHITKNVTSSLGCGDDEDKLTTFHIEICVFDDCSTDETQKLLQMWQRTFIRDSESSACNIFMRIVRNENVQPKGVGYGRNMAIDASSGAYLCFQDIDDEMLPNRILKQYALAKRHKDAIIGSKFTRIPPNSTCRFSRWANELDQEKLSLQIYTSNGPTVIMPTWLCHRSVYEKIAHGFCEDGPGTPEDLIFFYKHLDCGGYILRVDECLLRYNYHPEATTFSIAAKTIWHIRLQHLIEHVLCTEPWERGFTIWNAGKQGRKFFRDLPLQVKNKVNAFCDVDKKKIYKFYHHFDVVKRVITHRIPILHFTEAKPPLLICMKLDLTKGAFETNLKSLNLTEGKDYILFT